MISCRSENIQYELWGVVEGKNVYLFTLKNKGGCKIQLTNYGATLVSVAVPDKKGNLENVILNYTNLTHYINDEWYVGATIGRFANRIADGSFILNDKHYFLEKNDNGNSNHSGSSGFHAKVFDFSINESEIVFSLFSKDQDGGFPGNLHLQVKYKWNDDCELLISYSCTTDKMTIANFTNHAYFNLSGKGNILSHRLEINATDILEYDKDFIPTGKIIKRNRGAVQKNERTTMFEPPNLKELNECYALANTQNDLACVLSDRSSGRTLEVYTSYPGLMVCTSDFLSCKYLRNSVPSCQLLDGVALECQFFPDSPNHDNFPSTVLDVNEQYNQYILYKFGITKTEL